MDQSNELVVKYMYHYLTRGRNLAIAFEMPKRKGTGGPIRIAFAFCSTKDQFSRKKAREVLAEKLMNGDYLLRTQVNGQHVMDVVIDAVNSEEFHKKLPPSWLRQYPKGLRLRKLIVATAPEENCLYENILDFVGDVKTHRGDWALPVKPVAVEETKA